MYQPTERLKKHIREAEGFSADPYDDRGVPAIGYGDRYADKSKPMSVEAAERRLDERLAEGKRNLEAKLTRKDWSENEWDVLMDLEYNQGIGTMEKDGTINLLNNGTREEIEASIAKMTTSQGEELPALVRRKDARLAMWRAGQKGMQAEESDGFDAAIAEINSSVEDDGLADAINEINSQPVSVVDRVASAVSGLFNSSEISDPEELVVKQAASDLSKTTVLNEAEARSLLEIKDAKSIAIETQFDDIAKNFPVVSTWASNPDNYVLLKEKGPWAMQLESAAKPFGVKDMLKSYGSTTQSDIEKGALWAQFLYGTAPKQQTQNALRILDKEIVAEKTARQSVASRNIQRAVGEIPGKFEQLGEAVKQFIDEDDRNYANTIAGLKKVYDGTDESFASVMNAFESMIKNPEGLVQFMAEATGGSGIAGVAGGAAGAAAGAGAGFLTPLPFGTAAGAFAGYKSGSAAAVGFYSFGAYIDEALKEGYTDKATGIVDYDLAMSDPKFLKKIKLQAPTYGVTLGAADYLLSRLAGKFATKLDPSAGVKAVAKETAKGLGAQVGVEAGSELAARQAADVVGGEASIAKTFKNAGEAVVEGMSAGLMGGARLTGATAIEQAKQTVTTVKQAMSAVDDFNTLQELRAKMGPVEAKDAAATSDLVNQATKPQKQEALVPGAPEDQDETVLASDLDEAASQGTVWITPEVLEEYLQGKGTDAATLMSQMGTEYYDQYQNAKGTSTPISIPMGTWAVNTQEFADIDELVHINDNEANAIEAAQTLDEIKKNPFAFFETIDGEDVPESMTEIVEDENIPTVDQMVDTEDGTVMRPVDIKNRFRDEASRKAFSSIQKRLRAVTKDSKQVSPEYADFIAELQYRHVSRRARVLGQGVDQVVGRIKFGKLKDANAGGAFIPATETQGPYKVLFTPNATNKTLIHEISHSWLFEMSDDYTFMAALDSETMNADQKEYWQAMLDAADLLGLKDVGELNGMSNAEQIRIQETFAQTAEMYLMDGKFENNRIRRLMESFRKYMTKIAFLVGKTYPQYPALKISPQVERLFEVLIDATNAQQDELYTAFPPALPNLDILGKKGDEYRETYRLALSESVANFYGKIFNMSVREREAAIDKAIDQIYDDATAEVDTQAPFVLLKFFQDAYAQWKKNGGDSPRISFSSFARVFADGDEARAQQLKDMVPSVFVEPAKKGGLDVQELLYMLGITSPEGFLNQMIQAGKRDQVIEMRANELINERFPVMRSDKDIHEAAVEAVNKYGRERLLADEFRIMADKYLGTLKQMIKGVAGPANIKNKLVADELKGKGAILVGNSPRSGFSAGKFLQASNTLGREAAKQFVAGDFEAAFLAKSSEAEQFYAYRQAQIAMKQMAKVDQTIKKYVAFMRDSTIAKRKDTRIMRYGIEFLAATKLGKKPPFITEVEGIDLTGIDESTLDAINESVSNYMIEAAGKDQNTMTVGGYLALGQVLRLVNHAAVKSKTVELAGRKAARAEIGANIIAEVGPVKKSDPTRAEDNIVGNYFIGLRNVVSEFQSLFASDADFAKSTLGSYNAEVTNAEAELTLDVEKKKEVVAAAFRKLFKYDSKLKAVGAAFTSRLPGKLGLNPFTQPILSEELNYQFTNIAEVLQSLLYAGSESGRRKMIVGMGWGNVNPETGMLDDSKYLAFIDRMIDEGRITQDHMDFVQTVFDQFADFYPKAKEVLRYTDGIELGYVAPQAIKTKLGTIKGGYVPLKPKDMKKNVDDKLSVDNELYPVSVLFPTVNPAFSKNRTEDTFAVDLDLSKVVMALSSVANVAYMRKPLYDFASVLNLPEVKNAIEARRPGMYEVQIRPWFDRVKLQQYSPPVAKGSIVSAMSAVARTLRQRVAIGFYFINWKSILRQTTGLGSVAVEVGATRTSVQVSKFAAAPIEVRSFVEGKSKYMQQRLKTSTMALIESYTELEKNFDWVTWTDAKIKQYNYLPLQMMQNMVDIPAWMSAYQYGLDEKDMTEKQAVIYADNLVQNTQGANTVSSLANIQYGSELFRLFTTLSTYPIAMNQRYGNILLRDDSARQKIIAVATLGFFTVGMTGVLNSLLAEMSDDEDDEKKMKKGQRYFMDDMGARIFTEAIDTAIPVLGRVITSPITGPRVALSPILEQLNQLPVAAKAVDRGLEGVDMTPYEVKSLFNSLGFIVHPAFTVVGKGLSFSEPDRGEQKALKRLRRRQLEALKRESR
jgi:GH24 family phage-related lysozyme (muramidase)